LGRKSTDEIYAVGFIDSLEQRKAMMFEYDDSEWKRISLPKNNYTLFIGFANTTD
jgi:hypothetical protein